MQRILVRRVGTEADANRPAMPARESNGAALTNWIGDSAAMVAQRKKLNDLFGDAVQRLDERRPSALGVVQLGASESKVDETQAFQNEYARLVAEARTALLGRIGFGASPTGRYDKTRWEQIDDKDYKFAIKAKVKPSDALQALVASPGEWSFDCAEFVQVCNLYATMKLYGKEEVDKLPNFVLRQHSSTTLDHASELGGGGCVQFQRLAKGGGFDAVFPKRGNAYVENLISEEDLLKGLPVGARVCFKNPVASETPFRNENTLVDGAGTFAAHPMGSGLSAHAVIDKLVEYNGIKHLGEEDNGREQIFINQAEIYPSIPLSESTLAALKLTKYAQYL